MYGRLLLYMVAIIIALQSSVFAERQIHRLLGGHLKIINPNSNDAELLTASASGSRDKKQQKLDEEEKKTLSQQVADGKYGLIQKELFGKIPKRPGVLSYEENPEIPKDNINNLGGLSKNEIWLAENHLLVLKGGTYPPHDDKQDIQGNVWPAIDDYKAPNRQVKLPAHPKVPPPFPVQLTDDGPLQILGTNNSRTLNGTIEATAYALPPPEGYQPGQGPFFPPVYPDPTNLTAGQAPLPIPFGPPGEYPPGSPFPPFPLNGTLPPYFASLPPGAVILPPPNNLTDQYDEDDPSIYYPPPYSFYYPKDNSSRVPAGPLVPGIILPPPPNFFGPLEDTTSTTSTSKPYRQRVTTSTTQVPPQIHPTTTPLPSTVVTQNKINKKPVKLVPVYIPEINNELKPLVTTTKTPKIITVLPVRQYNKTVPRIKTQRPGTNSQTVTILRPVKPTPSPPKVYVYNNEVSSNGYAVYAPPAAPNSIVSTTQVPLKAYYSTSNEINTNSVTRVPEKFHIGIPTTKSSKAPAKYYFYEETPQSTSERTVKPTTQRPNSYYNEYYVAKAQPPPPPPPPAQPQIVKPKFVYVTSRPYSTPRPRLRFIQQPQKDTFSIHIARLQKQIHQYYTTVRPIAKPVYQYSFEAANYKPKQQTFKPSPEIADPNQFQPLPKYSVQIQQAVEIIPPRPPPPPAPVYYQQNYRQSTERPLPSNYYSTPRPDYDYEDEVPKKGGYVVQTPRPISQYSFEATQNPIYKQYYTKPDEGYYDDITKKYFTVFGQKLPNPTTPLPPPSRLQRKPVSLAGDTLVNYVQPRPTLNPQAELVPINPNPQGTYPQVTKYVPRQAQHQQQQQQQLASTRQRNIAPEIVKAVPVNGAPPPQQQQQQQQQAPTAEGQSGSFISYQLPGDDGAHFYFLTPQLAQRRDQGAGYYYEQPNGSRVRRNNNNNSNNSRKEVDKKDVI